MLKRQLKNHMLHEELEKCKLEWEKTTDSNTEMMQTLELFDKDSKTAILKIFSEQSLTLETNERKSRKKITEYKEETKGNFRIEKYNKWNKNLSG